MTIVDNLAGAIRPKVHADERFRQVAQRWSRCMAERGYRYRDPVDLRERFTTAPDEGERRVAVAEADCVVAQPAGRDGPLSGTGAC